MGRIIGIDFGKKRCGVSITDLSQIIVSGLDTIETKSLLDFLKNYIKLEPVDKIVFGLPIHRDGTYTNLKKDIDNFVLKIKKIYPDLLVDFCDENFTSQEAKEIIFRSGAKKKKRRDKALVDKISAVLILQRYLNHI